MRHVVTIIPLLLAAACSQRSPWVVVPAPERASAASAGERGASSRDDAGRRRPRSVALATAAPADATLVSRLGTLAFPVAGMDGSRVADSFDDPRDGGERRHNAIDILAPRGTPVLSVQDGRVLRLSRSEKGGITVYATDDDEQFVFYYAHLDRYHRDMHDGRRLARGDTIGFVGTTGNAPENVPHLHFQLMRMPGNGRYWDGEPVNPYPLLRGADRSSWR